MTKFIVVVLVLGLSYASLLAQEENLTGIELAFDSDSFADGIRDTSEVADRNYTTALRIGIYGAWADHNYLGLPWVRRKIDGFVIDKLIERSGFIKDRTSHNFVFIANGFSPSYINDIDSTYVQAVNAGYDFSQDRPFSSFTGFRSTRRIEGKKRLAHSAYEYNLAVNSSFTFGFASFGLAQRTDNWFKNGRPEAVVWERDESKDYPTGQVIPRALPLFMYSLSGEAAFFQPFRKILFQVRPELNLGYYTNVGVGLDIGKVMNVEKHVDNMGYTDTNNPSVAVVNNESIGLSITGGASVRAVLYDAHLNGLYTRSAGHFIGFSDMRKFQWEGHLGIKLQLLKKIEITYSVSRRSAGFRNDIVSRNPIWGTIGLKYLIGEPGEGCYNL